MSHRYAVKPHGKRFIAAPSAEGVDLYDGADKIAHLSQRATVADIIAAVAAHVGAPAQAVPLGTPWSR